MDIEEKTEGGSDEMASEPAKNEDKENTDDADDADDGSRKRRSRLSSSYHPIKDAGWKVNEPVPYLELCRAFAEIEEISGRLKTIEVMANLYRSVITLTPNDLLPVIYLCVNKIAPPYENLELGVGDSLLYKAIEMSTGRKLARLKADVEECGDLGFVAEKSRGKQSLMMKPRPLTCVGVFNTLKSLSKIEGNKSRDKKIGYINKLFVSAREAEARFIVRALQGKMRIGFSEQSILVAIARACALTPPAQKLDVSKMILDSQKKSRSKFEKDFLLAESVIKGVYSEVPNWEMVIPRLIDVGVKKLPEKCFLTPGIPIKAMLAKPTKGIQEILTRFAKVLFTLEFKYDGERIQIHYLGNGKFAFFSRNAETSTAKFPDIQTDLPNHFDKASVKSFIIDCEVVAFDIKNQKILPFQTLSTRKRKDVKAEDISVQVCLYAFDCLYLNGKSLLKEPFAERRKALHESFVEETGKFMFAKYENTSDPEDIQTFLDLAISSSCEGLMVKTLHDDATYEPSKRSRSWLKVKKDYLSGVGDTFDLVPIGGYHGRGKRTGVYGAFLVACYDLETEEYQAICKIGTGLKDDFMTSTSKFFNDGHTIENPPSYYRLPESTTDNPDVWFEPCQVWEVLCADLSISPKYFAAAGRVHESKGIALRFPRFLRIRDDKQCEDATSSEQVAEMYRNQANVNQPNANMDLE
uniref:DNA ligase n=2 Tax=Hirondellea gigas TaxID=1518452 RepID=A0A6A7G0Z5_9CRUS